MTANLSGFGLVTVPLMQTQPGVFVSAGPQRFDFQHVTDSDGDGIIDDQDQCPNTSPGAIINAHGCSIDQLAPCAGPFSGGNWKNHGHYVSELSKVARAFLAEGRITAEQADAIIAAAARSKCGKTP